ncbi:hypothetical protein [Thalassovita sp.]|uniref:hypothetical protein n=1 Tax=Thalassovita sp. TaxID=1979401 RepID=UPI0029DE5B27|nr:hypothetical protein [Thalassovita sp.]
MNLLVPLISALIFLGIVYVGFKLLRAGLWGLGYLIGLVGFVNPLRHYSPAPLFGFNRKQLYAFFGVALALCAHLIWYSQVYLPVPAVRLSQINSARKSTSDSLLPAFPIRWGDRIRPEDAHSGQFPFPRLEFSFDDPNYLFAAKGFSGLRQYDDNGPLPVDTKTGRQLRALICGNRPGEIPYCQIWGKVPTVYAVTALSGEEGYQYSRMQSGAETLDFNLEVSGALASVSWADLFKLRTFQGKGALRPIADSHFQIALDGGRRQPVDSLQYLADVALGRADMGLRVFPKDEYLKKAVELLCLSPKTYAEQNHYYKEFCGETGQNQIEYLVGDCARHPDRPQVRVCPKWLYSGPSGLVWKPLENAADMLFTLNRPEDRELVIMALRGAGHDVPSPDLTSPGVTQSIRRVIEDYRVVLGMPEAGSKALDRSMIKAALIRQPHLFAYYVDRAYWGPIIMDDLFRKLEKLGVGSVAFSADQIGEERTRAPIAQGDQR